MKATSISHWLDTIRTFTFIMFRAKKRKTSAMQDWIAFKKEDFFDLK